VPLTKAVIVVSSATRGAPGCVVVSAVAGATHCGGPLIVYVPTPPEPTPTAVMVVPGATPGPVTAWPMPRADPTGAAMLVTVSVVPGCAAASGVDAATAWGLPLTV
jgi:hypothetical protein